MSPSGLQEANWDYETIKERKEAKSDLSKLEVSDSAQGFRLEMSYTSQDSTNEWRGKFLPHG